MNDDKLVKAEDLARGYWPEILQHAGVDPSHFSGEHGPCPLCGGKDRYRWSRKHSDEGLWVCSGCTEDRWANGFRMLMALKGCSFRDAADFVREYFNGTAAQSARRPVRVAPRSPEMDIARNLQRMDAIWTAARQITRGDPVHIYLSRRVPGIAFEPSMVRFHPALEYWSAPEKLDGKPVFVGRFPAMVALAFDVHGSLVQLHKTYLTASGDKADVPVVKKTERGVGVNGFAVPMMPVQGETLGFAEGIESAAAAAMLRGIPVWPCLNGPSMAAFRVPDHLLHQVNRVVIFADHDELKPLTQHGAAHGRVRYRSAGSHYAEQLAANVRAQGKRVLVVKAGRVGRDMADHWIESHRAAPPITA